MLGDCSNNRKITIGVSKILPWLLVILCFNNLPLTSNFDSILYAHDTVMMLFDCNMILLKMCVNSYFIVV